ncbi:MAG TPA: dTDP-4-dehydrorhamnose 3,5-epimerase [Cyanobacteria bacterium UBA12227]|nr:dTDP-4-dehydrorhamnose 3,5-epimerase [Cyanobacteria bacterium UBA12227]HAX89137.1 dTDP-4-dehydrorhamnose 3,5-epimerase [Cyanobacteria bacterium UBA11370]HBY77254.1 dTDP-4-dehydrorhamnose 3,5-epimerase [Cyanobacteria bacterium UBA11148]
MSPANGIEICPVDSGKHLGTSGIHQPLFGHETTLVTIAPGTVEDLFVHHFQTDQLLVVQGSVVLVVLQNRQYQYILMSECKPTIVKIPPGIPHGAINMSSQPCIVINSVLRHGPADERDYRPLHRPFPYDLDVVKAML